MQCDEIRERLESLWESPALTELSAHLGSCPACAAYYRDLRLVRAGLNLWKRDEAPAPSLGFSQRLVRQLGSPTLGVANFFELVGRRFVYGALALALLTVLAIAVPSSGPIRALNATDIQLPAQEASLANSDPMGETIPQESPNSVSVEAPAVKNEAK